MATRNLFSFLRDGMRRAIEDPAAYLPALPGAGDSGLGANLDQLDNSTQQLDAAAESANWNSRAQHWHDDLGAIATAAFARPPGEETDAVNELTVRYLQVNHPRLAAVLATTGVLTWTPDAALGRARSRIDWERLQQLITDPQAVVNEQTLEDQCADQAHPHAGRIPAILEALLIMMPDTIRALIHGQLRVDGPPPPAVRGDPTSDWARFRNATAGWVSLTLPLGDPVSTTLQPDGFMYWIPDLQPDHSVTLAIRAHRRAVGLNQVTDFETWLAWRADQERWELALSDNWYLEVEPTFTVGFGYDGEQGEWHATFAPSTPNSPFLPAFLDDPVTITLGYRGLDEQVVWGPLGDTRLSFQGPRLWLKVRRVSPVWELGLTIAGLEVVLAPRWLNSLVGMVPGLSAGIRFGLDLAVSVVADVGVLLNDSGGMTVVPAASGLGVIWHVNKQLGIPTLNLKLHSIRLLGEFAAAEDYLNWRFLLRFHVSAQVGPLILVADGAGAWLGSWSELNPQSDEIETTKYGLLPPTGLGLGLQIGPVTGGGFLDFTGGPSERYAGLLHLRISEFEVTAFGIHELTPTGRTSFVAVLGARFQPGVQLGYGFALTGVGGLVAINRRLDPDALRDRLVSGAVGNVLFAPDPIRSAPTILGDLDALFPAADGIHVGGPTARISWIEQVHFDLGLLFEVATDCNPDGAGGLTRVILLGSAHSQVVVEGLKLVDVRLELAGLMDLVRDVIEFDAMLVQSKILDVFRLTGSAAFRLSAGDRPYAMLTMGGFHPDFNPEPARFPKLARLGIAYREDSSLQVRMELYFAITTNTLQLGARAELKVQKGRLSALGWIGFDALIQFRPFFFSVAFAAGFEVRYRSRTLAGVKVKGTLTGPGPLTIAAEFCIEILFFDICWSGSFALGRAVTQALQTIPSLLGALAGELSQPLNLAVEGGEDLLVAVSSSLRNGALTVVSPIGRLAWAQRRAPLETLLERLEGVPLATPQAVEVHSPQADGRRVRDFFSPGSFAELSQSEALNRASFERLPAGITLGFAEESSAPVGRNLTVTQYVLPQPAPTLGAPAVGFPELVVSGLGGRSATAGDFARHAAVVRVRDEAWTLRSNAGAVLAAELSQTDAHQRARRQRATALPANDLIEVGDI